MDIPRPDNFNETYLYEGTHLRTRLPDLRTLQERPAR